MYMINGECNKCPHYNKETLNCDLLKFKKIGGVKND